MNEIRIRTGYPEVEDSYEISQNLKYYYEISPLSKIRLLDFGEHAYYLVDDEKNGLRLLFRISNPGLTRSNILSELAWMDEIRKNTDILVPEPVCGLDGQFVQTIRLPHMRQQYHCVLFSYFSGPALAECSESDTAKKFRQLGEVTAKLHQNAILYNGSKMQECPSWDYESTIEKNAGFDLLHNISGIPGDMAALFEKAGETIRQRLQRFGKSSSRFGLINANMSLNNIVKFQNKMSIIHFEGCGLGWYLYDFATAVNAIDSNMEISENFASWCEGYGRYRKLNRTETDEVFTFVLLSRLHTLCKKMNTSGFEQHKKNETLYLKKTAELADRYLLRFL